MRRWNSSEIVNEAAAHKSNPTVVYMWADLLKCAKCYGSLVEPIVGTVLYPLGWPPSSSAIYPFPDDIKNTSG